MVDVGPWTRKARGTGAVGRATRLADTSRKVRKESLRVNAEFAAFERAAAARGRESR